MAGFFENNTNMGKLANGRRIPPTPPKALRTKPLQRAKSRNVPSNTRPLELTRDINFLDGTHDIFDILAQQAQEKDTLERSISATIALLNRSRHMLEDAEETIESQNIRLKTLETLSVTDEISGLLNRRGFTKAFVKEVARTNRGHSHGGLLVMFNLENLDKVKDLHGNNAVHKAIKLISSALENEIRETDYAARLYDDEFVLLFTNTSMENALHRLQNMALRLNKLSLIWEGAEIPLNLSLGLKSYGKNEKAEDIFESASDDLQRNRKGHTHTKHA